VSGPSARPASRAAQAAHASVSWEGGEIVAVDQRALPQRLEHLHLRTVSQLVSAIRSLAIRGAPAIGVAGALGVALSAATGSVQDVARDAERIATARPTAVNLRWGVGRALAALPDGPDAVLGVALAMLDEDVRVNVAASEHAADLVAELCGAGPLRVLTHCNTGRLATVGHGTALGTIRHLAERGALSEVLVTETRPLLQGARLTTWELAEAGIPHRLIVDSAAAWAMATATVDCVLVGADRVTANGDVVNKIGTYALAVAARRHGVPFIVVAPESTRDAGLPDGTHVVVEERDPDEITSFAGSVIAPIGTRVFNPAFDVTPAALVSAAVSENGVVHGVRPNLTKRIAAAVAPSVPEGTIEAGSTFHSDAMLFGEVVGALAQSLPTGVDRVLAIDAGGALTGAALADRLGAGLTLVHWPAIGDGALSVVGPVVRGERLVVLADVLDPEAALDAVTRLVTAGGTVVAVAAVLAQHGTDARRQLLPHPLVVLAEAAR